MTSTRSLHSSRFCDDQFFFSDGRKIYFGFCDTAEAATNKIRRVFTNPKDKERTSLTRTPSVRERVAQFMEAMHRKDFAEAKRIRKFTRSMCSPQHWSTECRLWLERNPDAALNKWFEQAAADLKARLEGPKSYMATRNWTPEHALLEQFMANRKWWQHLD